MRVRLVSLLALLLVTFSGGVVFAATYFADVPADHWAALSIRWVNEAGIMTGPGDRPDHFDPAGLVNRAQLATTLTRLHQNLNQRIDDLELQVARLEHERNLLEELLNGPIQE